MTSQDPTSTHYKVTGSKFILLLKIIMKLDKMYEKTVFKYCTKENSGL